MPKLQDLAASRRDFLMIDPRLLMMEEGYNIRDLETPGAKEALAELAESIAESGIRVPLLVRMKGETVYVVQGHRRLAAVRSLIERGLPIETVPCIGEARGDARNDAERTLDLLLSNDGYPLSEMEKAEGVRRLVNFGWDDAKIGARLGKGPGYVRHLKSLLTMPEAVQEMVRNDQVAAATALQTVRSEGEAAVEVLREAVAAPTPEGPAEPPGLPLTSTSAETTQRPVKPHKATPRRIEAAAEKVAARRGRERAPKKPKARTEAKPKPHSIGKNLDEALFAQISQFLIKCQNGHYEDEDHEVPSRLHADAAELSKTIKDYRAGFRSEAAE